MGRAGALGAEHRDAHAHVALTACQTRSEASRASGRSIMRAEAGLATVRASPARWLVRALAIACVPRSAPGLDRHGPAWQRPVVFVQRKDSDQIQPGFRCEASLKILWIQGGVMPSLRCWQRKESGEEERAGRFVHSALRARPVFDAAPKPLAVLPGLAACHALSLTAARFPLSSRAPIAPRGIRSEGWLASVAGAGGFWAGCRHRLAAGSGALSAPPRSSGSKKPGSASHSSAVSTQTMPRHAASCHAMPHRWQADRLASMPWAVSPRLSRPSARAGPHRRGWGRPSVSAPPSGHERERRAGPSQAAHRASLVLSAFRAARYIAATGPETK